MDTQFAYLRAIVAEPNRDRKKRSKPYEADDFALFGKKAQESRAKKEAKPQSWQAQKAYVQNFLHPFFNSRAKVNKNTEVK